MIKIEAVHLRNEYGVVFDEYNSEEVLTFTLQAVFVRSQEMIWERECTVLVWLAPGIAPWENSPMSVVMPFMKPQPDEQCIEQSWEIPICWEAAF